MKYKLLSSKLDLPRFIPAKLSAIEVLTHRFLEPFNIYALRIQPQALQITISGHGDRRNSVFEMSFIDGSQFDKTFKVSNPKGREFFVTVVKPRGDYQEASYIFHEKQDYLGGVMLNHYANGKNDISLYIPTPAMTSIEERVQSDGSDTEGGGELQESPSAESIVEKELQVAEIEDSSSEDESEVQLPTRPESAPSRPSIWERTVADQLQDPVVREKRRSVEIQRKAEKKKTTGSTKAKTKRRSLALKTTLSRRQVSAPAAAARPTGSSNGTNGLQSVPRTASRGDEARPAGKTGRTKEVSADLFLKAQSTLRGLVRDYRSLELK